jgi:hypothetical protein
MVNHIYVNSTLLIIGITIATIIVVVASENMTAIPQSSIVKIKDTYVYLPKHVMTATIAKYKKSIVNQIGTHMDEELRARFKLAERKLSEYIRLKHAIDVHINLSVIEKYIADEHIAGNHIAYTECDLHGYDPSEYHHSSGRILYLLDQILLLERNSNVQMPLNLDVIDSLLNYSAYRKQSLEDMRTADNVRDNATDDDGYDDQYYDVGDAVTCSKAKKCSHKLRHNLHDFISDGAAQDIFSDNESNQKAKNAREAMSSWRIRANYSEPSDMSEINDHSEVSNRMTFEHMFCRVNKRIQPIKSFAIEPNGKQSLTDKWDYLERQFLTN